MDAFVNFMFLVLYMDMTQNVSFIVFLYLECYSVGDSTFLQ